MTNKELSSAVRAILKENGYKPSDFSISSRYAGYEQSCNIAIKNPAINRKKIEDLVTHLESIDYDQYSDEILAGGNTFVFVQYKYGIFDEVIAQYIPDASAVIENQTDDIISTHDMEYVNYRGWGRLWDCGHATFNVYNAKDLAKMIYFKETFGTVSV